MADGPMIDRSGLLAAFLGSIPEPVKNVYRAVLPTELRKLVRDYHPYEQDMVRSLRFWANPIERRRRRSELQACQTLEDHFAFATRYLAHQQWKQEILGFLEFAATKKP
ncbi:MAG TPA: hypothetical protein VK752_15410, partial [Bryobacteraceae bacterium]|nr:hypothetical protein [Bryobacteraceae bacterium]